MDEIEEALKGFRPQFANTAHIRIMNKIGEINKAEELLVQKRRESKGIAPLEKKIAQMKKDTMAAIQFDKEQKQ